MQQGKSNIHNRINYISLVNRIAKIFNFKVEYFCSDDSVYGKVWSLFVTHDPAGKLVEIYNMDGSLRHVVGDACDRCSKTDAAKYFIFRLIEFDYEDDRPYLMTPEKEKYFRIPETPEKLSMALTLEYGI